MSPNVIFQALYQRYQSLFLTIEESAHELRIHPCTARGWISEGRFPCQTTVMNGRRLVSLGALVAYMAHESGADPEREEKNKVAPGSQQTPVLQQAVTRSQTEVVGVEVDGEIKKGRPSHLERAAAEAAGLSVHAFRRTNRREAQK